MRIDKFISELGAASRKEASKIARSGGVTVNGAPVRDLSAHIDPERDVVTFQGRELTYKKFVYVMLNKPEGYVSATEDGRYPVVTELAPPEYARLSLFPCGRLDRDTVGLMLLTNDGALSHALLSPKRGVEKIYRFKTEAPLPRDAEERLLAGMTLSDCVCRPARLSADADRMGGSVTLTEGKYHEVKRMMAALGAPIVYLERYAFAGITLDPTLPRGMTREVSPEELAILRAAAEKSREE